MWAPHHRTRRMARCPIRTDRHMSPGLVGEHKSVCIMLVCKCEPVPACHPQYGEKMLKK